MGTCSELRITTTHDSKCHQNKRPKGTVTGCDTIVESIGRPPDFWEFGILGTCLGTCFLFGNLYLLIPVGSKFPNSKFPLGFPTKNINTLVAKTNACWVAKKQTKKRAKFKFMFETCRVYKLHITINILFTLYIFQNNQLKKCFVEYAIAAKHDERKVLQYRYR